MLSIFISQLSKHRVKDNSAVTWDKKNII